ncbi:MAG TPA: response regulator [Candidatus Nitrosotenuis sp.]|jgi:CheY-like chemotaxis protein|nr:response regulator [Candidatus Nitrosotenuis sp.]
MLETPALALRKVLLVEDDEDSIRTARAFFGADRADLLLARSATECEQALLAEGDHLDAIVCEVALGPLEVIARLRHRIPHVPCVAIADRACAESALQALRAGAVDYVNKPVDWEQLWRVLQDQVAARRRGAALEAFHEAIRGVAHLLHHLEALSSPAIHASVPRQIVNAACMAAEADAGWLFLPQGQGLTAVAAVGAPLPGREDCAEGLFAEAYRSRLGKCVALAGDEDPTGLAPFERERASLLAVPLLAGPRALGVLELARSAGRRPFRPDNAAVATQMGWLGGLLLQSAHREERASRILVRTLRKVLAAHEERAGQPHTEVVAACQRAARLALEADEAAADPEDREMAQVVASLQGIRSLGAGHLRFWRDTLRRYLEEHTAR